MRAVGTLARISDRPGTVGVLGADASATVERLNDVSAPDATQTPSNLLRPATSLVGRRKELAFVRRLVTANRLVTLTGPGGIGKSRLGLEVAQRSLATFGAGVWRVDLSEISASAPLDRALTDSLGLVERSGLTAAGNLSKAVGSRKALLLLDECEWAVEPVARLVAEVLQSCPGIHVLATSRLPLNVRGETIYTMPTLTLSPRPTTVTDLGRQDAIALFVERARAQRPGFRLTEATAPHVHELCRRLDGLPLAIELAAARVRHYALEELVARLADQPALLRGGPREAPRRQQSLEAAVDWSLGLLSREGRSIFPMLAIFRGGFELAAVEAIGDGLEPAIAAEVISELVDHSLLVLEEGVRGRSRFRLLEPIRQHALGMLRVAGGEAQARMRHASHFAGMSRAWSESFGSSDQAVWLDRLEADHDNLRQALQWALAHDAVTALEMSADLSLFWCRRGHAPEGREWLDRALATMPHPPHGRRATAALAMMLEVLGDEESARHLAEDAVDQSIDAGDRLTEALAWMTLGRLVASDGDRARAAFEAAMEAARIVGSDEIACAVLGEFANLEWGLGRPEVAIAMAVDAVKAGRSLGSPDLIVVPATVLARDAMFAGRPEAESLWLECLQTSRELGDPLLVSLCLTFLALRESWQGDLASAAKRLAEAARVLRHVGSRWSQIYLMEIVGLVLLRAGRPVDGLPLIAWKELAMGPEWLDSPPWRGYVRSEVDRATAEIGDRAAESARTNAQALAFDDALALTEAEIERLLDVTGDRSTGHGDALSPRESEVARLTSAGLTNREIGRRLAISERTAEAHMQHILNKLGLSNRAQIAAWVVEQGRPSSPVAAAAGGPPGLRDQRSAT